MTYRIVAYSQNKELLTWVDDAYLETIKARLKEQGYDDIRAIKDVI